MFLLRRRSSPLQSPLFRLQRAAYSIKNARNKPIVDLLIKHKRQEEGLASPNDFKLVAFSKAIRAVTDFPDPIRSGSDVKEVRGIGPGIISRIDEFLYSDGGIAEDSPQYHEIRKSRALYALQSVPGIGLAKAKKLVEAGCLSLSDLRTPEYSYLLSKPQLLNLRYLEHLSHPLSRADIEEVYAFSTNHLDPKYNQILVGDYRRDAISCPDIKLMILHPDFVHIPLPSDPPPISISMGLEAALKRQPAKRVKPNPSLLDSDIVPMLRQRGLIADTVSSGPFAWRGIIRLPGTRDEWGERSARVSAIQNLEGNFAQMSIHLVPQKSKASALLDLTGDNDFHKSLCKRSEDLGMLLNPHGLWQWHSENEHEPGHWSIIHCPTEEAIFEQLGLDFVLPERRNFRFLSPTKRTRKTPSLMRL